MLDLWSEPDIASSGGHGQGLYPLEEWNPNLGRHESDLARAQALGQYFTPRWVAEAVVERYFGDLKGGDIVIEPSCGDGSFLHAFPDDVEVIGVEIDERHAAVARERTGRTVHVGDFLQVPLPNAVQAVVGNPPFQADTIAAFLARSHSLLVEGGRCGMILPAYVFQTSSKVMTMARHWSIQQEMVPRNLFPRLSVPLVFGMFTKERRRRLVGFFLYEEVAEVGQISTQARVILERSIKRGSAWRDLVNTIFEELKADELTLPEVYRALQGRRPTTNRFPEAKVRQVMQRYPEFVPVERGRWRRERAAAPTSA